MSVLIVDDSPIFREQLRADLECAGFCVAEATDGNAGLSAILGGLKPSLILSDINMPDVGGLQFLENLRDALDEHAPPIFVLSAERSELAQDRARELGVMAWVVKPYQKTVLLDAVRKVAG